MLREFDRDLASLFALNLLMAFSVQLINPLFPLYLEGLGASDVEVGLVVSLSSVVATALMLPSGILMDWVGRRRMLILSVLLCAAPPFLLVFVRSWWMALPLSMVFAASFSLFVPTRMTLIADSARPGSTATLFGLMNLAWPIGGIAAPILSGLIVERFGWGSCFLLAGGILAVSLIPALLIRAPRRRVRGVAERSSSPLARSHLSPLLLFFIFHLIMTTAMGCLGVILPLYLKDQFGLPYPIIGLFFTASGAMTLITQIPSGYLADRYGERRFISIVITPIPLLLGLWPLMRQWWMLLLLYTFISGLWSMTWPATLSLLSETFPEELRGTAFGVRMTGVRMGFTIGPVIAGYLYGGWSSSAPFQAASLLTLLGIPLSLTLPRGRNNSHC
ncbi:hypothetical protein DRO49_01605 [Candidatus Bathyarchaeota archaeon]|nr:MAG: hypothetical protein DRO49_01605 [Candidatus Bathyarchaeota archaeon]